VIDSDCKKSFLHVKTMVLVFGLIVGLAGCTGSAADRNRLAAQGLIQEDAPVKAGAEIVIAAPAKKIMELLTDINSWPQWQPDITKATVLGSTAVGTAFAWSTGGMNIHSTIQRVDPERSICWTGRMLHIHAIHCWTLSGLADDRVLVKTRESMDGWLISRMYSSQELLASDQRWLDRLKQAAER
jgi:uncharacterized protein YndB with AHSA1/START domain